MNRNDGRKTRRSRRRILRSAAGVGTLTLGTVAGCLGAEDDGATPRTVQTTETTVATDERDRADGPSFTAWTHETGHDGFGTLTLAPGAGGPAVYVGSDHATASGDGHALHAVSLPSGDEQWRVGLSHPPRTTPLYGGDDGPERLYFATGPETLHGREVALQAVDPTRGERAWTFDTDDRRFLYPLAATDDAVFVGRRDDQIGRSGECLYGVGAANGERQWRIDAGDAKTEGHAVRRDTAFLATRGRLHAVDPATGEERWGVNVRDLDGPAYDNRGDRVFLGEDGVVRALAVEDGRELWRREFEFTVSRVLSPRAAADDTVFVGDYDGRLLALSPLDGGTRWTLSVDRDQYYPGVERTSERLFVGGAGVHAVDPVSGDREWSFGTDREGSMAVSVGRTVFAKEGVRKDGGPGRLHALDPATGERRWSFAPDRRMVGLETPGDLAIVGVGGTVYALDGSG